MDPYSLAELAELFFLAKADADTQFQFWISITFAVIVASFVGEEHLTRKIRSLVAILYLLSTIVLSILFVRAIIIANGFGAALIEADVDFDDPLPNFVTVILGIGRLLLFLVGTGSALYVILNGSLARKR